MTALKWIVHPALCFLGSWCLLFRIAVWGMEGIAGLLFNYLERVHPDLLP
jgi:hypothetical protein